MQHALSRFLILLAVFCTAFLTVTVVRKVGNGESVLALLQGQQAAENHRYTLRKDPSITSRKVKTLDAINRESADLIHAVVPSVVSINTQGVRNERRRDFWGRTWVQPRAVQGQGSGVIVTREGHVLTNYHVVKGDPRIRLTMHGGKVYTAKIIGSDPTVDIAVLQIEGEGPFTPLKFGDSAKIEVGNTVFAIGSPFGLGETVTNGIISAKKRSFSDSQVDLLQTSAAINPGNSGGPLINIRGEIIGINSRIYSSDKQNPGFQGISFAIPSNAALRTMQNILAQGHHVRGFLGMALENLNLSTRKELHYSASGGVRILGVAPEAPAMKAGLRKNDIIIHFNHRPITNSRELITFIQQSKVGSEVELEIWRDRAYHTITATIGDAVKFNQRILKQKETTTRKHVDTKAILSSVGIVVRDPTPEEKLQGAQGVFIEQILPNSQLKGQLITGDLIRAINRQPVIDKTQFFKTLVESLAVKKTVLIIQRGQNTIQLTLSPVHK
jgi:S1-C subfamily serine protease